MTARLDSMGARSITYTPTKTGFFSKGLPLFITLSAYATAIYLISPWGEFPLNDDWTYSWVAKRFLETGQYRIDVPIAPSLVGQSMIVAPFVYLFGFSHVLLRSITITMGAVLLIALDGIFRQFPINARVRTMLLLCVVANPIFLNLACSFMTEIYGYTLALLSVWVWFAGRRRQEDARRLPWISWPSLLASVVLAGTSFWIRQFCVLLFPGLVASVMIPDILSRRYDKLKASIGRATGALCLLALISSSYLIWTRWSGNSRPEFEGPLHAFLTIRTPQIYFRGFFGCWIYITAFLVPFLLPSWPFAVARASRRFWNKFGIRYACWAVFTPLAVLFGARLFYRAGTSDQQLSSFIHHRFPLLGNIVYNAGVGPLHLPDVYLSNRPLRPQWPSMVWWGIYALLLALAPLIIWSFKHSVSRTWRERGAPVEALIFSIVTSFGLALVVIQAYGIEIFDRYYLGPFLAALPAAGILASELKLFSVPSRTIAAFAICGLLAAFSVAGTHDYFQWNEARWELIRRAKERGVRPIDIEGGYEYDSWTLLEERLRTGVDKFTFDYFPIVRPWNISLNLPALGKLVDKVTPKTWLAPFPSVLLSNRRSLDGAVQIYWNTEEATVNLKTQKVSFEDAATVLANPLSVISWNESQKTETRFFFIGASAKKEMLFVRDIEQGDTIRITFARRATAEDKMLYEKLKTPP